MTTVAAIIRHAAAAPSGRASRRSTARLGARQPTDRRSGTTRTWPDSALLGFTAGGLAVFSLESLGGIFFDRRRRSRSRRGRPMPPRLLRERIPFETSPQCGGHRHRPSPVASRATLGFDSRGVTGAAEEDDVDAHAVILSHYCSTTRGRTRGGRVRRMPAASRVRIAARQPAFGGVQTMVC